MSEVSDPQPRRSWGAMAAMVAIVGITAATFGADVFLGKSADDDAPRRLVIDTSFSAASADAAPQRVVIGKGRQTIVRVFAASCRSCPGDNETLGTIAAQHETDLVAISVGTGASAPTSKVPTVADVNGDLARRLGVEKPPMTLIVDVDGTVLGRRMSIDPAELGDLLDRVRTRPAARAR